MVGELIYPHRRHAEQAEIFPYFAKFAMTYKRIPFKRIPFWNAARKKILTPGKTLFPKMFILVQFNQKNFLGQSERRKPKL